MRAFDVVIVGAGASGTMAAAQLLSRARAPLRIALIEKSGAFGRGAAYGTFEASHVLNVRTKGMSAWPDDPEHFIRSLQAQGIPCDGDAFVSRMYFGAYLSRVLLEAEAGSPRGSVCNRLTDEATAIERHAAGWAVQLRLGERLEARSVLLACGNERPAALPIPDGGVFDSDLWVASPWDPAALSAIASDDDVLLVGTSLTSVDVVLSLMARGHRGRITAVSRHGLLPRPHPQTSKRLPWSGGALEPSARGLLRGLRRAVEDGQSRGEAWQDVVDSLRPQHAELWGRLSMAERRRFLRHLRARWDVVRHRMAPEVFDQVESVLARGQLEVLAGRPLRFQRVDDRLRCTIRSRGTGSEQTLTAHRGVNCTGPASPATSGDPLLTSLFESGFAVPEPLGLGILTRRGQVIDREGGPQRELRAMGSLRKGELWESVAIPELRVQAAEAAQALLDLLD